MCLDLVRAYQALLWFQVDFDLTVTRDDVASPVVVALGMNRVAINFQENESAEKVPILVARSES